MPMKIEIKIKGLSLCFDKKDVWNIVFVCDPEHDLKFTNSDGSTVRLDVPGQDREIAFASAGTTFAAPAKGRNFKEIFNMASADVHQPNMLDEDRSITNTHVVRVTLPSATLDRAVLTDNYYYVQDLKSPGLPPLIVDRVAKELIATFEVDQAGNELTFTDVSTSIAVGNYPYVEGSTLAFEFDNHCNKGHLPCEKNDFMNLYEIVKDKNSSKEFAAGQIKYGSINSHPAVAGVILSPDSGNCDPIGCDPPPGD